MSSGTRRRVQGAVFVVVLAVALGLAVGRYAGAFGSGVPVTLKVERVGNQLAERGDVKVRGLVVGTIEEVTTDGAGATVRLSLQRDKVAQIPSNVSARLVPKTLFGEKYVSLVLPEAARGAPIAAGDVITQDRSRSARELDRVLDGLVPLLQAVEPQDLATTLGALSQALSGRGENLGDTLVRLHELVGRLNPALPDLQADITELADLSGNLADAAPDLLDALADFTVTSRTIVEQRANLRELFGGLTQASDDLRGFLAANEDNLIGLAASSRPTLESLARYSAEFPCLFSQLAGLIDRARQGLRQGHRQAGHLHHAGDRRQQRQVRPEPRRAGVPRRPRARGATRSSRWARSGRRTARSATAPPHHPPRSAPRPVTPSGWASYRRLHRHGPAQLARRAADGRRAGRRPQRQLARGGAELEQHAGGSALPRVRGDADMTRIPLAPLLKFTALTVVVALATTVLALTIANASAGGATAYTARFTDAAGLLRGDDVRIAGVVVGTVEDVRIVDRRVAEVEFSVAERQRLPASVTASILYKNLIGQRFLALGQGAGPTGTTLPAGGTIPVERTRPALNLTTLFNGFKPLFAALDPKQVNQLSFEIVQVLQGQGGTVRSLLASTSSLTNTLADRDAVIGQVIDNLNAVLDTVNGRDQQLSDLVASLQALVSGLAEDRKPIGDAIVSIGRLTEVTAGFVDEARPALREDIAWLGDLAGNLDANEPAVESFLQHWPGKLNTISRAASYGSWFQFYLCGVTGEIGIDPILPAQEIPAYSSDSPRCGPDPDGVHGEAPRCSLACRPCRRAPSARPSDRSVADAHQASRPPRDHRPARAAARRGRGLQRSAAAARGHRVPGGVHRGRRPHLRRPGDDRRGRGGPGLRRRAGGRPGARHLLRGRRVGRRPHVGVDRDQDCCSVRSTSRSTRRASVSSYSDTPIPLARTASPFDVVEAVNGLSGTVDAARHRPARDEPHHAGGHVPRHGPGGPRRPRRAVEALHHDRGPRRGDPQAAGRHPQPVRGARRPQRRVREAARRTATCCSPRCSGARARSAHCSPAPATCPSSCGGSSPTTPPSSGRRSNSSTAWRHCCSATRRTSTAPSSCRRSSSGCSPTPSATAGGSTTTSAVSPRRRWARSTPAGC